MANPAPSDVAAAEKLALTLAGSLLLHFALIFGLQLRAVSAPGSSSETIIQARLVPAPRSVALPQPAPGTPPVAEPRPAAPSPQAPPPPASVTPPSQVQPAGAAEPEKKGKLPSIEIPLLEDPIFYPPQEVDVHPTALQSIQPPYPAEAERANTSGSVMLALLLDESGAVRDISVEESNPPGVFDQSALESFRHARFTPAWRHGRAVKSRVLIKVTYEPADYNAPIDKTKQK